MGVILQESGWRPTMNTQVAAQSTQTVPTRSGKLDFELGVPVALRIIWRKNLGDKWRKR